MFTTNGARTGLYVLLVSPACLLPPHYLSPYQWLFSIVLLSLSGTRLHYTISLPPQDPLDNGPPFYEPIVIELAVTSILALFWSSCMSVSHPTVFHMYSTA